MAPWLQEGNYLSSARRTWILLTMRARNDRSWGWLPAILACTFGTCTSQSEDVMPFIEHLNPPGMHVNPAFSHAIAVSGAHRTVYIGGQNAVDAEGNIVGVGDIAAQAAQVARNLELLLATAGATPDAIVKWGVHVVAGQPLGPAMQAFYREFGRTANPATVTVLYVPALAHPDFLIEIDAVAVLPPTR